MKLDQKLLCQIFKNFETALFKEDLKPFKVPEGIYLYPIDYDTGKIFKF